MVFLSEPHDGGLCQDNEIFYMDGLVVLIC